MHLSEPIVKTSEATPGRLELDVGGNFEHL